MMNFKAVLLIAALIGVGACEDESISPNCRALAEQCQDSGMCYALMTRHADDVSGELSASQTAPAAGFKASQQGECNIACVSCAVAVDRPVVEAPVSEPAYGAVAEALCDREYQCHPLSFPLQAGEREYCVAKWVERVMGWETLPGAASLEEVTACVAAAGCDSVDHCYRGSKPNGDTCLIDLQCASAWCTGVDWECGICADRPGAGSACSDRVVCPWDHQCIEGRCEPRVPEGGECSDGRWCAAYHTCVGGTCRKDDQLAGESCGPDRGQPWCEERTKVLGCDRQEGVCKAVTLANPGDPCPTFGYCTGAGGCFEGVCRGGPEPGDACDESQRCRWPGICVNGMCRKQPAGNPCGP